MGAYTLQKGGPLFSDATGLPNGAGGTPATTHGDCVPRKRVAGLQRDLPRQSVQLKGPFLPKKMEAQGKKRVG